jgi:hypothetical protein
LLSTYVNLEKGFVLGQKIPFSIYVFILLFQIDFFV